MLKLREQKWADPSEGHGVVSDGVVRFWALVGSDEELKALRVAADNIPGVGLSHGLRTALLVRHNEDRSGPPAALEDQQAAVDFLSEPSSYGSAIERVDIIETHVSLVFLAGDRAYKLKRAVKYPYLDFSTEEKRRRACDGELALNRRTAPTLYLEVRALVRGSDGKITFVAEGPAIDWLVVMRRFEQSSLFDALAQTGGLNALLMNELAGHIAGFHAMAERSFDHGGAAALTAIVETNHGCLRAARQISFSADLIDEIRESSLQQLMALSGLIDRRSRLLRRKQR